MISLSLRNTKIITNFNLSTSRTHWWLAFVFRDILKRFRSSLSSITTRVVSHQRLRARIGDKVEDGSGITVGGKNLFFRRAVDRDILFQFRLRNYTYPRSFVLELTLCPQLRGERWCGGLAMSWPRYLLSRGEEN